ncbi:MAG: S53 family peptidase [Edaphobacter sp.]
MPQSVSPRIKTLTSSGHLSSTTILHGVSLYFNMTVAQKESLQALLIAQQTPGAASFHAWLTPEQFASSYGLADADIAQVSAWLEQQGMTVDSVSRNKRSLRFSGTVSQIEAALKTNIETFNVNGTVQYANATDISLPASLEAATLGVRNLDSFRPKPHWVVKRSDAAGQFTSSQTDNHYLTPADIAAIYDIKSAYSAGYTGTGQAITLVGQSAIVTSDIENFQNAAGLTVKDPTIVLVPDSGSSAVSSGDEAESDLDIEYSGSIANGAATYFVYVGNNSNYSVFDSLQYAVDNRLMPVISISYGTCETDLSSSDYSTLNGILEQAALQGQTVTAASGDSGSTDCYANTDLTSSQQTALAVDFPASSQYVTGLGGSEFPSADVQSSNTTYWTSASGSDVISSATSYIPEQVWNDDSSSGGLSSGGGGISTLTARPNWQTGVLGITTGSYRLVPDLSLSSSPNNAGYLYCSSDPDTGITGSCSHGFRDTNDVYLTVAGGTSFAAPIFAGMVAIVAQKQNSTGLGNINSTLYSLAASSSDYSQAFHDITSGSNECTAGSNYCISTGETEYPAGTATTRHLDWVL